MLATYDDDIEKFEDEKLSGWNKEKDGIYVCECVCVCLYEKGIKLHHQFLFYYLLYWYFLPCDAIKSFPPVPLDFKSNICRA